MVKQSDDRSTFGNDEQLVARFASSFEQLDDLFCGHGEPLPEELSIGLDPDDWSIIRWRPAEIPTAQDCLDTIYERLSGRFPALYERLVLTYRWLEVHLGTVMLLANPPGPTLDGLAAEILRDPILLDTLLPAGFVPFGRVSGGYYDPMCFDLNSMRDGDCPIILIEHEAILCQSRIGKSWQRYSSFRELMRDTIELAQSSRE